MKGDPLPYQDNVVRYVGGSKLDDGIVLPEAFNDTLISVNWLEFKAGGKVEQVARVRKVLRLKVGKTAVLAELNVASIRDLDLDVLENPLKATNEWPSAPCHAEIVGTPTNLTKKMLIFEQAADIVTTVYPAYEESHQPN
ncbi:MAG: hypothetical protein OXF73_11480 [Gammaproteobacteria bacterium]|nr:hypothetical protein [Gammaproteobacteria bacterium]MCY4228569.1 hypothetical protein [Gammaproteobacteria bacterium]